MPIGGMQNRSRRIPRPSRSSWIQARQLSATDNAPGLSRHLFSMGMRARERPTSIPSTGASP